MSHAGVEENNVQGHNHYSSIVEVEPSSDPEAFTGTFRKATHPHGLVDNLLTKPLSTCWDIFLLGCLNDGKQPCVGTRALLPDGTLGDYVWKTYSEIAEIAYQAYRGLDRLGLIHDRDFGTATLRCFGIFMKNRLEWVALEQMANLFDMTIVALYSTLGPQAIAHIVTEAHLDLIFLTEETFGVLCDILGKKNGRANGDNNGNGDHGETNGNGRSSASETSSNSYESFANVHIPTDLVLLPRYPCLHDCHHCPVGADTTCPNCSNPALPDVSRATKLGCRVWTWGDLLLPSRRKTAKDKVDNGKTTEDKDGVVPRVHVLQMQSTASLNSVQTICYTSGTTGLPKGVVITHRNLLASVCGCFRGAFGGDSAIRITHDDCHLSHLPMAHIYERIIINLAFSKGARIGMFGGDMEQLLSDAAALRPTVFVSVPRLFYRVYDKVHAEVAEKHRLARWLFHRAVTTKLTNIQRDPSCNTHAFWDRLIFHRLAILLGGRIRYFLVAGGALDARVQDHIAIFFSVPLLQGYGLTEVVGGAFHTTGDDPSGYIGAPLPSFEFKLKSVPELNYRVTDQPRPRGELLLRGPAVTSEYFLNAEDTADLFEGSTSWMRTGDVVELDAHRGLVRIIDRRKNIFKLVQGEYILPDKLEAIYERAGFADQVFVYGRTTKAYLVAIVVPNVKAVQTWYEAFASEHDPKQLQSTSDVPLTKLCDGTHIFASQLTRAVLAQLCDQASSTGCHGFEKIRDLTLTPEPFSVENGLLTPTLKLRRHVLFTRFENAIDLMYKRTDAALRERRQRR